MACRLVVRSRLPDRRTARLRVPDDLAIGVELSTLISDGDDLAGVGDFLSRDAQRVSWNPQKRRGRSNAWGVVSVLLLLWFVLDMDVARYKTTHGSVVVVDVRLEKLGNEVRLFVRRNSEIGAVVSVRAFLVDHAIIVHQTTFLCFQALWQVVDARLEGRVESTVVDDSEDKEENHENERTDGTLASTTANRKETDDANFRNVDTDEQMTESLGVDTSLGINLSVVDEEEIVAESEVEEIETDGGEEKDQWCDNGIADSNDKQVGVDWEKSSPTNSTQADPSLVHLSWSVVKKLAKDHEDDETSDLDQHTGSNTKTLQTEV